MREPSGGTVLEPDTLDWVIANKGPEHAPTCERCHRHYYSPRLRSQHCWPCWYELEMQQAENMFRPLSTELERRLEVKTSVDQTGGMVMCLRVPIGRPAGSEGWTRRYAYFGEYPSEDIGVGLYVTDEHGDILNGDGCGEYHEWPGEFRCGALDCRWYHHPDLCEQVAEWAAPIIVDFATGEAT